MQNEGPPPVDGTPEEQKFTNQTAQPEPNQYPQVIISNNNGENDMIIDNYNNNNQQFITGQMNASYAVIP